MFFTFRFTKACACVKSFADLRFFFNAEKRSKNCYSCLVPLYFRKHMYKPNYTYIFNVCNKKKLANSMAVFTLKLKFDINGHVSLGHESYHVISSFGNMSTVSSILIDFCKKYGRLDSLKASIRHGRRKAALESSNHKAQCFWLLKVNGRRLGESFSFG